MPTVAVKPAKVSESFAPTADSQFAWRQIVEPVEPFLQSVAKRIREQIKSFEHDIAVYTEYALTGQGKQLRPVLVGLSGGAAGRLEDAHVTLAVIIEMVHLATLVHDDVMDGATMRRARPTLAANWGNDISVLVGDCLFAHALELAASYPTTEVCRAVSRATNTVCAGEILQTKWRRNFKLTQADYFKVLSMKTGELFALACDLGAGLTGAREAERTALRQYGMALGTAYQIYDDCVDLFGTEAKAGKSLGTDLAKGKLTLPVLLLREDLRGRELADLQKKLEQWDPSYFPELQRTLKQHQALLQSRKVIDQYLVSARGNLETMPSSVSCAGLHRLTDLLERMAGSLGGLD